MWLQFGLFILYIGGIFGTATRFTNVECEVLDSSYLAFKQCELKVLGRGIVGLNIEATFVKGGFNNALINLSLWRKFNGYRPFMFNSTFDFCKFMLNENPKLSFVKLFMDVVTKTSNVNHTCPYSHAIIFRNLVFDQRFLKFIPIPGGEYKLQLRAAIDREWITNINIQVLHTEDLINSK